MAVTMIPKYVTFELLYCMRHSFVADEIGDDTLEPARMPCCYIRVLSCSGRRHLIFGLYILYVHNSRTIV